MGHTLAVHRVAVVGSSGSGKTTVASRLAARLGADHIELDAIFHQPNWHELPRDVFRERVQSLAANDRWVIDGNYAAVQELVWARADTVVWLDLPRLVVTARVIRRTIGRVALRRPLWNDNRERLREVLSLDPQRSIVAWTWKMHPTYAHRYGPAATDPQWAHLRVVRLKSHREVNAFLAP